LLPSLSSLSLTLLSQVAATFSIQECRPEPPHLRTGRGSTWQIEFSGAVVVLVGEARTIAKEASGQHDTASSGIDSPTALGGELEAYSRDLYAVMAFGMRDLRAFARE
jgi:hypothetical protein